MSACKVSVIVPVYCAERYIDRCVNSILAQTESDIEVLLIDDGSTDQSGMICDALAQHDHRIRVFHKHNAGVSAARNMGLQLASGKYISFVDADDYIEADMLSTLVSLAEKECAEITVCGYFVEQSHSKEVGKLCCCDGVYAGNATILLFQNYFTSNYSGLSSMCNKLYLRSYLASHHFQADEHLQRAEDFWFNFEVFQKATCIVINSVPLYHYVQNETSIMHQFRPTQFQDWTQNRIQLLKFADAYDIHLQYSSFYYQYVYNTVILLRSILMNQPSVNAVSIMKSAFLQQAMRCVTGLPLHISLITFCIKHGFYRIACQLLSFWGGRSGK